MADAPLPINPWEANGLDYAFPEGQDEDAEAGSPTMARRQVQDPSIYPGLYSATGFDMMGILLQVMSRPNPQIDLGPIDCSVALTLCDLASPDQPIVYASDSFCDLTGYHKNQVVGRNCRFLQSPPPGHRALSSAAVSANKKAAQRLRRAIHERREIQVDVINYRSDGQAFTNRLSIIPVSLDDSGFRYALGLQVDLE